MNTHLNSPSRLWILCAVAAGMVLAGGCGNKTADTQAPTAAAGPVAPAAKPDSDITKNNPPPGQPNHMTPEMQAQIERYRALGRQNNASNAK